MRATRVRTRASAFLVRSGYLVWGRFPVVQGKLELRRPGFGPLPRARGNGGDARVNMRFRKLALCGVGDGTCEST